MENELGRRLSGFVIDGRRQSNQAQFEGSRASATDEGAEALPRLVAQLVYALQLPDDRGLLIARETLASLLCTAESAAALQPDEARRLLECACLLAERYAPSSELSRIVAALLSLLCAKERGRIFGAKEWAACAEVLHRLFKAHQPSTEHIVLLLNLLEARPQALDTASRRAFAAALSDESVMLDARLNPLAVMALQRLGEFPLEAPYPRQLLSLAQRMRRRPTARLRLYPLFRAMAWLASFHAQSQPESAGLGCEAVEAFLCAEELCGDEEGFLFALFSLLNSHPAHLAALLALRGVEGGFALARKALGETLSPDALAEVVLFLHNAFRATGHCPPELQRLAAVSERPLFASERLDAELGRLREAAGGDAA